MSGVRFLVSAAPGGASHARRALTALTEELPPDVMSRLGLLLSELVSHAPKHTGTPTPDTLEVSIEGSADTVRVKVRDIAGTALLPTTSESESESRWDIMLLERMSDRWGIHESPPPREIWFEVDRWSPPAPTTGTARA